MLQALKHRGPDSTGYALYGEGSSGDYIMRFKVGENVKEGSSAVNEDESVYKDRKKLVDQHIINLGANIYQEDQLTPYSFRYVIKYDKDLMEFSKKVESVEMTEILSLGKTLELVKDIGDATVVQVIPIGLLIVSIIGVGIYPAFVSNVFTEGIEVMLNMPGAN